MNLEIVLKIDILGCNPKLFVFSKGAYNQDDVIYVIMMANE